MPNGGVPIHMVLLPKQGDVVLHCSGSTIRILSRGEWNRARAQGESLGQLDEVEARALLGFLRYWAGDGKRDWLPRGGLRQFGVDLIWDY